MNVIRAWFGVQMQVNAYSVCQGVLLVVQPTSVSVLTVQMVFTTIPMVNAWHVQMAVVFVNLLQIAQLVILVSSSGTSNVCYRAIIHALIALTISLMPVRSVSEGILQQRRIIRVRKIQVVITRVTVWLALADFLFSIEDVVVVMWILPVLSVLDLTQACVRSVRLDFTSWTERVRNVFLIAWIVSVMSTAMNVKVVLSCPQFWEYLQAVVSFVIQMLSVLLVEDHQRNAHHVQLSTGWMVIDVFLFKMLV